MCQLLHRRGRGRFGSRMRGVPRILALAAMTAGLGVVRLPAAAVVRAQAGDQALKVQITSPLGRTGISGPTRIVARIASAPGRVLSPVQFFVDGQLVGEDKDGA